MREFKRAQESMEAVIRAEMYAKDREDTKKVAESTTARPVFDDDDDEDEEEEE
jgi:hypothetical protein